MNLLLLLVMNPCDGPVNYNSDSVVSAAFFFIAAKKMAIDLKLTAEKNVDGMDLKNYLLAPPSIVKQIPLTNDASSEAR